MWKNLAGFVPDHCKVVYYEPDYTHQWKLGYRLAAVLFLIAFHKGELHVLMTKRSQKVSSHKGAYKYMQVANSCNWELSLPYMNMASVLNLYCSRSKYTLLSVFVLVHNHISKFCSSLYTFCLRSWS